MVLEATMICLDNSEWMRNGDYSPNRLQSQLDAVNVICGSKTQMNPESTVGMLTTGGKNVRILLTPTTDLAKILTCTHGVDLEGESNLIAAVQIAHLALKHRLNKSQRQRIIFFAGSPVSAERSLLESIGRWLRRNNVALDIINFGEMDEEKTEKLEALHSSVNTNDNCRIVHVEPMSGALHQMITPILGGDGQDSNYTAPGDGPNGFEFGVDPNTDPELALALRISMEEERARQEAMSANEVGESSGAAVPDVTINPDKNMEALFAQALAAGSGDIHMEEGDEELAQALQMSLSGDGSRDEEGKDKNNDDSMQ